MTVLFSLRISSNGIQPTRSHLIDRLLTQLSPDEITRLREIAEEIMIVKIPYFFPGDPPNPVVSSILAGRKTLQIFFSLDARYDSRGGLIEWILSSLVLLGKMKENAPRNIQQQTLTEERARFLDIPDLKNHDIPKIPFPGIVFKENTSEGQSSLGIAIKSLFIRTTSLIATKHPPLIESQNWSGKWGETLLTLFYICSSRRFFKELSVDLLEVEEDFSSVENLKVGHSKMSAYLKALLKLNVISTQISQLKAAYGATDVVYIISWGNSTFQCCTNGEQKVLVFTISNLKAKGAEAIAQLTAFHQEYLNKFVETDAYKRVV